MRSPTKRRRYDGHVDEPVEDAEEVSPSESAPDDQSASDGETRGAHTADLSPLLTRAMTVDMDLIPLIDVDLPDPQPADTAALESLPRIQMPLDSAPLDEARLDIGEVMSLSEVSSRSERLEILRMSSGVKVELQDLSKAELLRDLVMDPLPTPPSRDSSLATLVLPCASREEEEEDAAEVLGELLDEADWPSSREWPSRPPSPPPARFDAAALQRHARWQDALRAALAKADGYTRSLVGAAAANSPCGTMVVLARISPRQISALHPPVRGLVQQLLDATRAHAAVDHRTLERHAFDIASLSKGLAPASAPASAPFSPAATHSPSLSPPSSAVTSAASSPLKSSPPPKRELA